MKKSIVFVLAVLMAVSAFSNNGDNPQPKIVRAFQQQFTGATGVIWKVGASTITARFSLDNSPLVAYFTSEGEYVGIARSMVFDNLPVIPMKAIMNSFPGAAPYEVVEYNVDHATSYVMTIEAGSRLLRVQVSPTGDVNIIKKRSN